MICRPIASIFYDEVQFGDQMDRTTVGGRISCLRLHFVYFENWLFLKLLIIKSIFFFVKQSTLRYNFLEWRCRMSLFKKKKVERKL